MINLGDKVGFLLPNPATPGDRRGFIGRDRGRNNPTTTLAEVLQVKSSGLLCLDVKTPFGSFFLDNISQDETKTIVETWHRITQNNNWFESFNGGALGSLASIDIIRNSQSVQLVGIPIFQDSICYGVSIASKHANLTRPGAWTLSLLKQKVVVGTASINFAALASTDFVDTQSWNEGELKCQRGDLLTVAFTGPAIVSPFIQGNLLFRSL
jgi:hypothetical protein